LCRLEITVANGPDLQRHLLKSGPRNGNGAHVLSQQRQIDVNRFVGGRFRLGAVCVQQLGKQHREQQQGTKAKVLLAEGGASLVA